MNPKEVIIIVAYGLNHEIGAGNALLWKLKDDMRMFKSLTTGHSVIMGRKTFESIGRPLPNRQNIVISRSLKADGIEVVSNLAEALNLAKQNENSEKIFIIGGGQVYNSALEYTDTLVISEVQAEFPEADTFFPDLNFDLWDEVSSEFHARNEDNEYNFYVRIYRRKDSV